MDIYVYSDESGTFDKKHHDFFVYGGLILLSEESRNLQLQKYLAAEAGVRADMKAKGIIAPDELKASKLAFRIRERLFSASNLSYRFGVIENLKKLRKKEIFTCAENKTRHQDYLYKRGLKRAIKHLIRVGKIDPNQEHHLHITADEHAIATSGYKLDYSIEKEFTSGVYHPEYGTHKLPILSNLTVDVKYVDSKSNTLVRAADIVANRLLYRIKNGKKLTKGGILVLQLP